MQRLFLSRNIETPRTGGQSLPDYMPWPLNRSQAHLLPRVDLAGLERCVCPRNGRYIDVFTRRGHPPGLSSQPRKPPLTGGSRAKPRLAIT
eukprot:SAG25_NODE_477_length_7537_cov_143.345657_7_plen_91_part_00